MKLLSILFFLTFSFLSVETDEKIDGLFLAWNRNTLNSLKRTCAQMQAENDRSLCSDRAASMPGLWSIDDDSLNRSSVRWRFLKKIKLDTVSLAKNWTIVEVVKSGERIRLANYVLCFRKSDAMLSSYEYSGGEWVKLYDKKVALSKSDVRFPVGKALLTGNSYPHDVVVTNFVHDSILESNYHIEHTIDNGRKFVSFLK